MRLRPLAVGEKGFDTVAKLTFDQAASLAADGFSFVVIYLDAADAGYVLMLTSAGLSVMATSYSRAPGWTVTSEEGATSGGFMVQKAKACGLLPGVSVYLDLEGMAHGTSGAQADAYVRAATAPLQAAGYVAGAYIGDSVPLDAAGLYHLPVTGYWRSMSSVPTPANVGYQLYQLYDTQTVRGVSLDVDVAQKDYRGRVPVAMVTGG